MSSTRLSLRPRKKASSSDPAAVQAARQKEAEDGKQKAKAKALAAASSERSLQFDLFAQLSYMASVSTAGVSRSELFQRASALPYSSSLYFRRVHLMAQRLNMDYAEACRLVAERTRAQPVKRLLLRLAGSLSSGEDESEFLLREAQEIGDRFGNEYERDVESLKKWSDAYVTLIVSAGLIVIVAVISMMIYDIGTAIVVGLAFTMVGVACLGSWIIYISAPKEIKTRLKGASSSDQLRSVQLFKILGPTAVMVCSLMVLLKMDLGWVLLAGAGLLFPVGFLINRDDKAIARKDSDIPTVVRVLGTVTSAIGSTVTQALWEIDQRSMGSLMPEIKRLRSRLKAGVAPPLCWSKFVDETGSELIDRTVTMFWDALSLGGEAGKIGVASSYFSSKIAYLRATRGMVASTFRWLVLPLHGAMVGLLLFIPEVMRLFSLSIQKSSAALTEGPGRIPNSSMDISQVFTFGQINIGLVTLLSTSVVLVITVANAFAPKAADGGHNLKFIYNLAIMMAVTGVLMIVVPMFANSLFASIVET